jgi:hypothetical protein
MKDVERDLESRRHAASLPLFAGCFAVGHVPTWLELADAVERLRLEGATSSSAETLMGAAAREARLERRRAAKKVRP